MIVFVKRALTEPQAVSKAISALPKEPGYWSMITADNSADVSAEMRLPGRAWLEFEVTGDTNGSVIRQTATFDPKGLSGLLYWYSVYPVHQFVFGRMLRGTAGAAENMARRS